MSARAGKTVVIVAIVCVSIVLLVFGRNHVTGARMNFGEPVHVVGSGERVSYHVAPSSYRPSTYIRISGMTWFSWGGESSWGLGRVSTSWPVGGPESGRGWARIEVSCLLEGDGNLYYSEYDIEWLDGDTGRDMDGWEDGEVKIMEGECVERPPA
ncbi:hypothetical protein ACFV4I_17210 [Nocardiopsis alba]|uniref:hypothetical protein n=1 Tax=Nocardiopsis alba TaxID=53437 RepID=UPI00366A307F